MTRPRLGAGRSPWAWALVLLLAGGGVRAGERAYVDVGAPAVRRMPIAVAGPGMASPIQDPLAADLRWTGYFDLVDPKGFLETPLPEKPPDFRAWRLIGADGLVVLGGPTQDAERLTLRVVVYDAVRGLKLVDKTASGPARGVADAVANLVVGAFTGEGGIFGSQIAFLSNESGHKEAYAMGIDGSAIRSLTRHRSIVLSPRWSPDGQRLLFSSFRTGSSTLWVRDLRSGIERIVSNHPGLNIAGQWSPDGKRIALTQTDDEGNPQVCVMPSGGGEAHRLTRSFGISVSPSWSPDGKRIVFISDRSGPPHLFVMDEDGGNVTRITFGGRKNESPTWSPRGDWIAFQRMGDDGRYDLWRVTPDGSQEFRLTAGPRDNMDPTWSPDGRYLAFISNRDGEGDGDLYYVHWTGGEPRRLLKDFGVLSAPNWSIRFALPVELR